MIDKRIITYSSKHSVEIKDPPIPDIDRDPLFVDIFNAVKNHTMTAKVTLFSLYKACQYVAQSKLPGHFVECGVWRGGCSLLAALTFRAIEGENNGREFWLYDTFEGMTAPTEADIDRTGTSASHYIAKFSDEGKWCYAGEAEVDEIFRTSGFRPGQYRLIKGDVCETLRERVPESISILRLDTDWYESTKTELEIMYPRLVKGGVLIIDDYGHWEGSRQATDSYFENRQPILLNRVDHAVRMGIKISD